MVASSDHGHMANFISNVKEVDRLSEIHAAVTKKGPGRKHNVEVLHKSGIVLLIACWEAYVEDLATNGLSALIDRASSHTKIPPEVLERIAGKLQGMKAWDLAGDGWRRACRNHLKEVLARTTGALNTPRAAQVDELFEKALGIKALSSSWTWQGRTARSSQKSLDDLVTLRGSIAHRVTAARSVGKADVEEARELISRLAVKSHNAVNKHLDRLLGERPWEGFWYGETR